MQKVDGGNGQLPAAGAKAAPVDAQVLYTCIDACTDDRVADGDLEALLCREERRRALTFEAAIDRTRYVVAHALLRRALEAATGRLDWPFYLNPFGKPLLETFADKPWHFSLSHTRTLAICALSDRHEVGVDTECCDPMHDITGLARRYFARSESEWLAQRDPATRAASFYRIWTCKEAVIKALGRGLSFPLDVFSVTLDGDPPRIHFEAGSEETAARWALHTRTLGGNEVALAIRFATAAERSPSIAWREVTMAELAQGLCPRPLPD